MIRSARLRLGIESRDPADGGARIPGTTQARRRPPRRRSTPDRRRSVTIARVTDGLRELSADILLTLVIGALFVVLLGAHRLDLRRRRLHVAALRAAGDFGPNSGPVAAVVAAAGGARRRGGARAGRRAAPLVRLGSPPGQAAQGRPHRPRPGLRQRARRRRPGGGRRGPRRGDAGPSRARRRADPGGGRRVRRRDGRSPRRRRADPGRRVPDADACLANGGRARRRRATAGPVTRDAGSCRRRPLDPCPAGLPWAHRDARPTATRRPRR